eukprot:2799139-Amphidinium_carterae.2
MELLPKFMTVRDNLPGFSYQCAFFVTCSEAATIEHYFRAALMFRNVHSWVGLPHVISSRPFPRNVSSMVHHNINALNGYFCEFNVDSMLVLVRSRSHVGSICSMPRAACRARGTDPYPHTCTPKLSKSTYLILHTSFKQIVFLGDSNDTHTLNAPTSKYRVLSATHFNEYLFRHMSLHPQSINFTDVDCVPSPGPRSFALKAN